MHEREGLIDRVSELEGERREQEEKYAVVLENNARLEKEVEEFYGSVMGLAAKEHRARDEGGQEREELEVAYSEMKAELQQVIKNNMELESLAEEWETQGKGLQDKCLQLEQLLKVREQ